MILDISCAYRSLPRKICRASSTRSNRPRSNSASIPLPISSSSSEASCAHSRSNTHRPTPRLPTIHPPFRLHPIACLALYSLSPSLYLVLLRLRSPVVLTKSVSFRTISPSFVSASPIFGPPSESPFLVRLVLQPAHSASVLHTYALLPVSLYVYLALLLIGFALHP